MSDSYYLHHFSSKFNFSDELEDDLTIIPRKVQAFMKLNLNPNPLRFGLMIIFFS